MTDIRALLFDMDGVVIDTHESVTTYWNNLAAQHQVTLTAEDFARHIYGCPFKHTIAVCFPKLTDDQQQTAYANMIAYEEQMTYVAVPGVIRLLRQLKQLGIPSALVTSGEPHKVNTVLGQLAITNIFSAIVTAHDITHGKPHPEPYQLGAQKLSCRAADCVVFEDAVSGLQSGVAAGAWCVGLDSWGNREALLAAGAQHIIRDFQGVRVETHGHERRLVLDGTQCLSLLVMA